MLNISNLNHYHEKNGFLLCIKDVLWLCGITAGVNDVWNEKSLPCVRRHSQRCKTFSSDAARKISEASNVPPGSSSGKACSSTFDLIFFPGALTNWPLRWEVSVPNVESTDTHAMRPLPLRFVVQGGCSFAWDEVSCSFRVPNPYIRTIRDLIYKTYFCRYLIRQLSWTETGRCYVELMPKWVLESFAVSWFYCFLWLKPAVQSARCHAAVLPPAPTSSLFFPRRLLSTALLCCPREIVRLSEKREVLEVGSLQFIPWMDGATRREGDWGRSWSLKLN